MMMNGTACVVAAVGECISAAKQQKEKATIVGKKDVFGGDGAYKCTTTMRSFSIHRDKDDPWTPGFARKRIHAPT